METIKANLLSEKQMESNLCFSIEAKLRKQQLNLNDFFYKH